MSVSEEEPTLEDKNLNQKEGLSIVKVRDVEYKINMDDSIWKNGPVKFAQRPAWSTNGQIRPSSARGLPQSNNTKWLKKMDPFQNFQIFPSVDPYPSELRQLFRILLQENPWIEKSQTIIQKLVVRKFTTEITPRGSEELSPEQLEEWKNKPIDVPFFDEPVTPIQIKKWIDNLFKTLDLKDLIYDAYLFAREQGRTAIGMFPEGRDPDTGKYVMPQALRLIRPELLRRPLVDFQTSELVAVEVTGLTTNGSRFDANRLIYIQKGKNHDLFSDFYGKSDIRSLADIGKVGLVLYGRDYLAATINTWHTPYIFKHNVPGKDFSQINTVMDNFNIDLANNAGKDISVSYNVELLNPSGSNSGDIAGLIAIDEQHIETIAGQTGVPLFLLSKGKTGNLGGNANQEEAEGFIEDEIEPEQELLEQVIERQAYDRVIAIMFDVEPRDVADTPIRLFHKFEKPIIRTQIDPARFNMDMQLVDRGATTMEKALDDLGMADLLLDDTSSTGGDPSPTIKTQWPVSDNIDNHQEHMHNAKIGLLEEARETLKLQNSERRKSQAI